jgi:hypothetical protein
MGVGGHTQANLPPGPIWMYAGKLSPPPLLFDPLTFQPVASRYTD